MASRFGKTAVTRLGYQEVTTRNQVYKRDAKIFDDQTILPLYSPAFRYKPTNTAKFWPGIGRDWHIDAAHANKHQLIRCLNMETVFKFLAAIVAQARDRPDGFNVWQISHGHTR